jgi:predicted nucleotidyltransferase
MNSPEIKYINIAKNIILKYVPKNDYAVFLFGSRADGTAKKTSDIDIGFIGSQPLSSVLKADMEYELGESIIPYKVDLIDFSMTNNDFRQIALKNIIVWNHPKNITIN